MTSRSCSWNRVACRSRRSGAIALSAVAAVCLVVALAACERRASEIHVDDAWARPASGGDVTAAYLTIRNTGAVGDTLNGARTPVARVVEIHRSETGPDDVTRMRPVDAVPLPLGASVSLEPGGYHLMLVDVSRPLQMGQRVPLTFEFAQHDTVTVNVEVRRQP